MSFFSFFWIVIIKDILIYTQDIIGNNSTESFYWWKAFYQIYFAESDVCISFVQSTFTWLNFFFFSPS